jgi:hypothetical protein
LSKEDLLLRAHKVVDYFARKRKDAKSTARVYMPEKYRTMMRVFRSHCFTFTEQDVADWEELIKILKKQERCKQKML